MTPNDIVDMRCLAASLLVVAMLFAGSAAAHVPEIGPGDRVIDEPDRSWAFYDELAPGDTHTWTFTLNAGDPLFVGISVPLQDAWVPEATLHGPTGNIPLERENEVGFEPATPYTSRDVWSLNEEAPATGTYELTLTGTGGRYAFGYGLAERFTLFEWVTIPIAAAQIHLWEGHPVLLLLLPYIVGLGIAAAFSPIRAPRRLVLIQIVTGLFLGTALERLLHMGLAVGAGAQPPIWAWLFTATFLIPPLVLAAAAGRARRPWALFTIGIIGFLTWSGWLLGPALAIAAASIRSLERARTTALRRRPRARV